MTKQFRMYVTMDNAAFEGSERRELARILQDIATRLEQGEEDFDYYQTLRDANGNDVGRAGIKPIEEELCLPGATLHDPMPAPPSCMKCGSDHHTEDCTYWEGTIGEED